MADLTRSGLRCEVLYLHAEDEVLLRRYAETRRRHPLAGAGVSLADAIAEERRLLHPLIDSADLVIDTSRMSVHELRDLIGQLAPHFRQAFRLYRRLADSTRTADASA
ncbi:MAG: RNase adapter RapZ, partial [Candidatus Eisenbacteria bacterium]